MNPVDDPRPRSQGCYARRVRAKKHNPFTGISGQHSHTNEVDRQFHEYTLIRDQHRQAKLQQLQQQSQSQSQQQQQQQQQQQHQQLPMGYLNPWGTPMSMPMSMPLPMLYPYFPYYPPYPFYPDPHQPLYQQPQQQQQYQQPHQHNVDDATDDPFTTTGATATDAATTTDTDPGAEMAKVKSDPATTNVPTTATTTAAAAIPRRYVELDVRVTCIRDLLRIVDDCPADDNCDYNIDVRALSHIRPELVQIDAMVGLTSFKTSLLDQLLYFMQDLHTGTGTETGTDSGTGTLHTGTDTGTEATSTVEVKSAKSSDYKHMVLYGPPGTGKTQLAKLVGAMYAKLGVLSKNVFRKVTRTDLVAGYLGQTAIKTKKVVEECLGGCLFIDEVYALGNGNGMGGKNGAGRDDADSYSKECIDTLCEALSDHKDDLMVIVAGYKTHVQNQFFGANPGLESRFIWQFELEAYTADELCQIFVQKVADCGWSWAAGTNTNDDDNDNDPISTTPISAKWFEGKTFTHLGRDMEMLLTHTKIAHGRRVYGLPPSCRRRLTLADVDAGHAWFLKHQSSDTADPPAPFGMYV